MNILTKLTFIFLLLFSLPALSAEIILNWSNAGTNVNGDSIPTDTNHPASLESTIIYWGACLHDFMPAEPLLERVVSTTVPNQNESVAIIITTPGNWCFYGVHKNKQGGLSDASNPVFKTVYHVPAPPANLTVQGETVYYVIQRANRFLLLPVGTVAIGTPCNRLEYVNGFYVVPTDQVTWTSNTRPLVVVAQCEPLEE